ncbi:MAG: lysophospholipase [Rubricoccaceae bacterium]
MDHRTAHIRTPDGLTLFTRHWLPFGEPAAHVVLAHGIHEHSGRYAYPAGQLLRRGLAVHALDHRGHGQSEGARGTVERFDDFVDDLRHFVLEVREAHPDAPLFLMGHSMGGLMAASCVARHGAAPLAGLVLSSPALRVEVPWLLRTLAPVVARWLPAAPAKRIDLSRLSHDPRVARQFREDEHAIRRGVGARLGYEVTQAAARLDARSEAFALPLYVFHGTADAITDPEGSRAFVDAAPSPDKTLRLYDGLYHETLNEYERDTVIGELADWLVARAEAARGDRAEGAA